MLKKGFILFLFSATILFAGYKEGKDIFKNKCSSCHGAHISMKKLKENFFENDNKQLKIDVPTVNMLAYAIMDSPKHLGDSSDPEMQQIEIEEFLKSYNEKPDLNDSICDPVVSKYYKKKKPLKEPLTDEEAANLAMYFMEYTKWYEIQNPKITESLGGSSLDQLGLIKEAKAKNKKFIVYATSKTCYFCKRMEKRVLDTNDVKKQMAKDYIFLKVEVDKEKLPFDLQRHFKGMTPTFFFLSKESKLEATFPGAWKKQDYLDLLKEQR